MPRIFDGTWPPGAQERAPGVAAGKTVVLGRAFAFACWDSRTIELTLVPGRVDPGGTGLIPEALRPRLVAAFNGGFRSVHGHYGLRAEGRTFAPPRAGLATAAQTDDGTWWLGTASARIGDADLRSFRQNLPPLLEGDRFDPSGKASFGALAPGKSAGRTTRSALGLRDDGIWVYVYGIDVTAEELAAAVRETGARYGMGLDINDGQAGFEWLEVRSDGGDLDHAPSRDAMQTRWRGRAVGHAMQAERLSVPMGIPLPRWVRGDPRDYFVLARADSVLPAARLGSPEPGPAEK